MVETGLSQTQDTIVDDDVAAAGPRADVFAAGSTVGRYVVLDTLGRGGMGVVYTAYDPELDRRVAIKLVNAHGGGVASENARARLVAEARALAQLHHVNVVAVHDVGTVDDDVFIAMEFVQGLNLRDWLRDEHPTPVRILDAFVQAGRGLAAAHARRLVHRDFKPANVVIDAQGLVKVLDFGLARREPPDASGSGDSPRPDSSAHDPETGPASDTDRLTRFGAAVGTPAYMAPEQMMGLDVTPAADQFSFCVALYEALHGQHPFGNDEMERAKAILDGRHADPPSHADVAPWIRDALVRGIALAPTDRWPSMDELLAELTRTENRRSPARWGWGFGLALGAGLLAVAAWPGAEPQCSSAAELAERVWSPARRDTVASAFASVDAPYAAPTWQTVENMLDAYADQWAAAQVAACASDESPSAARDGVTACLDRAGAQLDAVVDSLSRADADMVSRAAGIVSRLPDLAQCKGSGMVGGAPPIPDPGTGEQVAQLRNRLARAHALINTRAFDEGRGLLDTLAVDAAAVDYPALEAEIGLERARLEAAAGRLEAAADLYDQALRAALRHGHDLASLDALLGLARVDTDLAHHASALRWAALAEALADRIGVGAAYRAELVHMKGMAKLGADRVAEALDDLEESAELHRAVFPPDHPELARALLGLANAYYRHGERERAEQLWLGVLESFERTSGPSHPNIAVLLNNLGALADDAGRYEEAIQRYQRAIAIREATLSADHPQVAGTLVNLGNVYLTLRRYPEAVAAYERARGIRERALGKAHPGLADVLGNLANAKLEMGELESAQAYIEDGLGVLDRATDEHPRARAALLRRLAVLHRKRLDPAASLEAIERALAALERADMPRAEPEWRSCGYTKALALRELGRHQDAVVSLRAALAAGPADDAPENLAPLHLDLARSLRADGADEKEVAEHLRAAAALVEGLDTESGRSIAEQITAFGGE